MDSFLNLSKQIQKQSELINSTLAPLKELSGILATQTQLQANYNLSGMNNISNFAKSFSQSMLSSIKVNETIFKNNFKSIFPENNYALNGLTQSLSQIAMHNKVFSEKLSNYATSQLVLSNNLNIVASIFKDSHLQQFNSIQVAIQGLSKSYLRTIEIDKNWNDIEIAENVNNVISKETEKINEVVNVTLNDLEKFKDSIIGELNLILSKTKSEKARLFIFDLIAVLGFLISLYSTYQQETSKTTQDVIEEVRDEIQKSNIDLSNRINLELAKLNKTRIAKTDVKLRYSTKKNSKIIGIVKSNQEVSIIEIQHKYLLISYLDKDNGEPKSGFVIKKYFEK